MVRSQHTCDPIVFLSGVPSVTITVMLCRNTAGVGADVGGGSPAALLAAAYGAVGTACASLGRLTESAAAFTRANNLLAASPAGSRSLDNR